MSSCLWDRIFKKTLWYTFFSVCYLTHPLTDEPVNWPLNKSIDLVGWVFANGLGDRASILGWVIPKTQKMVFDASLLTTQHYKVQIKGKVEQSRETKSKPSPTPWCCSYWKGSLWVAFDYSRPIYIYIYIYV